MKPIKRPIHIPNLLRHMRRLPLEFLIPPRIGNEGRLSVAALVWDAYQDRGWTLSQNRLLEFAMGFPNANFQGWIAVSLWGLEWEGWEKPFPAQEKFESFLENDLRLLADEEPVTDSMQSEERLEEWCRLSIRGFGFQPEGESSAEAEMRLEAVSSGMRRTVLAAAAATAAAARRALDVQRALAKKAAAEAADKWTRE